MSLVVGCTLAAAALGVARSIRIRSYAVDLATYEGVARRLSSEGRHDRLEKLNTAAGKAVYPRCVAAAQRALMALPPDRPASLARATAEDAYRAEHSRALDALRVEALLDLLQLALSAGALLFGVLTGLELSYVAAGATLVALVLLADGRVGQGRIRAATPNRAAPLLDLLTARRDLGPYRVKVHEAARTLPSAVSGPLFAIVEHAGQKVACVPIDQDVTKLGRLSSCALHLDDPEVSRMHAVLERSGDELTLIDLGSETGTRIDGERVNKQVVRAGSRFEIGPFSVRLSRTQELALPAPPEPTEAASVRSAESVRANSNRVCAACGKRGFAPLDDAPESVVPPGYRAEHCKSCGKVELFLRLPD